MIREIAPGYQVTNSANPDEIKVVVHLAGDSDEGDTPPEDVNYATGSDYLDVHLRKVYFYSEAAAAGTRWKDEPAGGGS